VAPVRIPLLVCGTVAAAALLYACEDELDKGGGSVEGTLQEWSIQIDTTSLPSGEIDFKLRNQGPDFEHELVIIRTDFSPEDLPTREDGSIDERAGGVNVIGRIQKFEVDRRSGGVFRMAPGSYVFACNLVSRIEGEKVSHYQRGMWTAFTVE
jgi:hypothetical protein